MQPLNCYLNIPQPFIAKAKYTLETLLFPLGLTPVWTNLDEATLRYQEDEMPISALNFRFSSHTIAFFEQKLAITSYHELDDLAKCFFWLSDFQTELVTERDHFGRLCYENAVQKILALPDEPFVDIVREKIEKELLALNISVKKRKYGNASWAFCPTHDIDHVQKYNLKRLFYNWRHSFESVEKRKMWKKERQDASKTEDIYQTGLRFFANFHQKHETQATYFLKAGNKAPQDHSYRLDNTALLNLVADKDIGLHPNFHAHQNESYFAEEVERLSRQFGATRSIRQHYLRYHPKITPDLWEKYGFLIDSTLAFPDKTIFRNQTCLPFKLYNLAQDCVREVWEMPLVLHDTVLFNYEKRDLADAMHRSQEIIAQVKRFGGVCVALWHPVIYDRLEYPLALDHFTQLLPNVKQQNAYIGGLKDTLELFRLSK